MKKVFTIIIAGIALYNSCTSVQNTYSEVSEEADFSRYRTFAWLPKDSSTIDDILYDNQIVQKKLQHKVNDELESRGFSYNSSTPDLLLQYTIIVDKQERLLSYPVYSYSPVGPQASFFPYYPNYPYDYNYALNHQYYLRNGITGYDPYLVPRYNSPNVPFYSPNYLSNNAYPWAQVYVGSNFQQVEFEEGTIVIDAIDRNTGELLWRGWSVGGFEDSETFREELSTVLDYIFDRFPVLEKQPEGIKLK
jgi:hypothetical protein